jgi:hypothetical protein
LRTGWHVSKDQDKKALILGLNRLFEEEEALHNPTPNIQFGMKIMVNQLPDLGLDIVWLVCSLNISVASRESLIEAFVSLQLALRTDVCYGVQLNLLISLCVEEASLHQYTECVRKGWR